MAVPQIKGANARFHLNFSLDFPLTQAHVGEYSVSSPQLQSGIHRPLRKMLTATAFFLFPQI